jgi:hypothetical protein
MGRVPRRDAKTGGMSPPDAQPPPSDELSGGRRNTHQGGEPDTKIPEQGDLARYQRDKGTVDAHMRLHLDVEVAAVELAQAMGGRVRAHMWARALLKACE